MGTSTVFTFPSFHSINSPTLAQSPNLKMQFSFFALLAIATTALACSQGEDCCWADLTACQQENEMIPASATPVISSSLSARTSVLNVLMETAAASSLERSLSVSKCSVKMS